MCVEVGWVVGEVIGMEEDVGVGVVFVYVEVGFVGCCV